MAFDSTGRLPLPGKAAEASDTGNHPLQSNRPAPPSSNSEIVRYAVFLILEAAFTTLAWYCHVHPIPLSLVESLGFKDTTVKSGFTAIFSVWHTIAVTSAFNICAEAFSREWAAIPDHETDAVSTVTSGLIDRILYFFQPRATKTFQVAFLGFLGLLLMHTISPSGITVSSGIEFSQKLPIGLISTTGLTQNLTDLGSEIFFTRLVQANMVVRLEQVVGVPWGYEPEQNWLIPLPIEDALQSVTKVAYNTDLVSFHHDCHWQAPSAFPGNEMNTFTFDNETWGWRFFETPSQEIYTADGSRIANGSSIAQLLPESESTAGKSVFLVLGGNTSIPVNSTNSNQTWVDLSRLPSLYSSEGFVTYDSTSSLVDWVRAPLASLLICDPHLAFTAGGVIFNPVANITALDVTRMTEPISRTPSPGNIDPEAARTLFTSVLAVAIGQQDTEAAVYAIDYLNINSVAAQMLLQVPADRHLTNASAVQPLDIGSINQNVDVFTLSALKAFTSGYRTKSDIEGGIYETSVDAYYTRLSLALATSVQFAILHTVLFGLLGIVLVVVAFLNVTRPRFPFTLEHVKQA